MQGSTYREFAPGPAVAEVVARYWSLTVPGSLPAGQAHTLLPDGCADLVVVGRQGGFFTVRGPRDTPLDIALEAGDRFWGARLWPDCGGRLLGVPATSLRDIQLPASTYFGDDANAFALRITENDDEWCVAFDTWLGARLERLDPLDTEVRMALLALHLRDEGVKSTDLGALVGLSTRQLQRRFSAATGLTVKTYTRIRRLRRTVGHLLDAQPPSWARLAATLGFADQSHMIAEFRRLAGGTPEEVARHISSFEHTDVMP